MPKYDFKCDSCGVTLEKYFSFDEERAATCECGAVMKQVFTATPAHFKGGGWGGQ